MGFFLLGTSLQHSNALIENTRLFSEEWCEEKQKLSTLRYYIPSKRLFNSVSLSAFTTGLFVGIFFKNPLYFCMNVASHHLMLTTRQHSPTGQIFSLEHPTVRNLQYLCEAATFTFRGS